LTTARAAKVSRRFLQNARDGTFLIDEARETTKSDEMKLKVEDEASE
jgi:hypothetical protein